MGTKESGSPLDVKGGINRKSLRNATRRMSAEGFDAFIDAISRPAAPVTELVEVIRRAAPWEKSP